MTGIPELAQEGVRQAPQRMWLKGGSSGQIWGQAQGRGMASAKAWRWAWRAWSSGEKGPAAGVGRRLGAMSEVGAQVDWSRGREHVLIGSL